MSVIQAIQNGMQSFSGNIPMIEQVAEGEREEEKKLGCWILVRMSMDLDSDSDK